MAAALSIAVAFLVTLLWGVMRVPEWSTETIGEFEGIQEISFLGVDSEGVPHVMYVGEGGYFYAIRHAEKSGSGWAVETAYTWRPLYASRYFSAAMDAQDRIHVCTYDGSRVLTHIVGDESGWTSENISVDGTPYITQIALDEDGHTYIASTVEWYDGSLYRTNVTLTDNVAGDWESEAVLHNSGVHIAFPTAWFQTLSLVVDGSGSPHLLLVMAGNSTELTGELLHNLYYGHREAGVWSFSLVDTASKSFGRASLVLDPQGAPHVIYYKSPGARVADGTPYYLNHAMLEDGNWAIESLWQTGNFYPEGASMILDSSGDLHIAFFSNFYTTGVNGLDNHTLWYGHNSGGEWTRESAVDDIGGLMNGANPSLLVDSDSDVSIVYCDHRGGDALMTYVTNEYSTAPYWSALVDSLIIAGVVAAVWFSLFAVVTLRRRRRERAERRRIETGLNE